MDLPLTGEGERHTYLREQHEFADSSPSTSLSDPPSARSEIAQNLPLHRDAGSPISPTVAGAVGARSPPASPSDVLTVIFFLLGLIHHQGSGEDLVIACFVALDACCRERYMPVT
jgi:hypothetical protein